MLFPKYLYYYRASGSLYRLLDSGFYFYTSCSIFSSLIPKLLNLLTLTSILGYSKAYTAYRYVTESLYFCLLHSRSVNISYVYLQQYTFFVYIQVHPGARFRTWTFLRVLCMACRIRCFKMVPHLIVYAFENTSLLNFKHGSRVHYTQRFKQMLLQTLSKHLFVLSRYAE